jgi:hypothetical protein
MTDQPTDPFATSRPGSALPPAGSPYAGGPGPLPDTGAPSTAPEVPAVVPVVVARRSTAGGLVNVLLGVALVVAVGGVAFAAGRATAPAAAATNGRGFNGNGQAFGGGGLGPNASGAPGRGGFGGAFAAGGLTIEGTVTAVTADSITLQLTSGQSITIPTDSQTTYHTRAAAKASDVATGSTVLVQLSGGRGTTGGGGLDGGPAASGAPGRTPASASSVTVVPAGS